MTSEQLSNELDRVMKINPYWRDMVRVHGRKDAELELMFEISSIEIKAKRREKEDAAQQLRDEIDSDWNRFLDARFNLSFPLSRTNLAKLNALDAKFIEDQHAKGYPIEFLKTKIANMQQSDAKEVAWMEEKRRRAAQDELDRQLKKIETEQRRAATFAKAVRIEAEKLIKDLLKAGVIHVSSK